ncbi:membrane-bound O-acyltransferase family protein [Aurantibacter aestuarii]|uniref:Membrane-bound O-acyltransferase family protein n=1 Tax=Aurantibacter aestuarii TaxID=1266046 RepID=A0A2T1NDM1_9FLAO|nr:membrane-bound O-acyltransferase family protein [Aurantibacter aestuarii]
MLFSSPFFLYLFLPATLFCYFLSPSKFKNSILLLASLFFYTWGERHLVLLIIASGLIDFCCGLVIERYHKKLGLTISIAFNLSLLMYFKYAGFVSEIFNSINLISNENNRIFNSIILPLGISFYTFQTMSYSIDVYRGKIKATKSLINFLTYVSLFPQLIAGPIVRYAQVEKEISSRKVTVDLFYSGILRFVYGLAKKLIVANQCAFLADGIFALHNDEKSMLLAWIGLIAYGFQIFFDFSGYSDMAIGLGKMFGFNFPENFNYPYISKSVKEFWRRWHITLSEWFKDYLYISLGGNRISVNRTYLNLLFVFFITGLWHGANWTFIIWGLFHGFFILMEKRFEKSFFDKLPNWFLHVYLMFIITFSWAIFRSNTITDAWQYIKQLFNFSVETNFNYLYFYMTKEVIFAMLIAFLLSTPKFQIYIKKILKSFHIQGPTLKYLKVFYVLGLFFICQYYIASGSYNPFIYFRF